MTYYEFMLFKCWGMDDWRCLKDLCCPVDDCVGRTKKCKWICSSDGNDVYVNQSGFMKCVSADGTSLHVNKICNWRWGCNRTENHCYTLSTEFDREGFIFALSHAVQLTGAAGALWAYNLCIAIDDQYNNKQESESRQNSGRRIGKKKPNGIPFPDYWDHMGGQSVIQVVISSTSPEWQQVAGKMRQTLPQSTIHSIKRIQNIFMWEFFAIARRRLEKRYGKGGEKEKVLFHGTSPDYLSIIVRQNLDPRLAGDSNGTLYGKGTYFAVDASYSDGFAEEDNKRHKFMFMAKVLTGECCQGKEEYVRPPPVNAKDPAVLYDSCVDNVKNPKIYCIFHDSQFHLDYIIEYV